jgi:hypothetical protein
MKHLLLVYGLFTTISVGAQPNGKKYVLPLVKWTMTLPEGFVSIPSRDTHVPIVPGRQDTAQHVASRSLLTAMSGPNLLVVSVEGCDPAKPVDNPAWEKRAYNGDSGETDSRLDSASTEITIDGVAFTTFILIRRKNELIQTKRVLMWTCYKGYILSVMYLTTSRKVGEQLNAMLRESSFH